MKIFEFNGVRFNLDALKGYTKEKFVSQNKAKFKDANLVWDMIADKIEVAKPKKKGRKGKNKAEKIEEKLAEDKATKPEFE